MKIVVCHLTRMQRGTVCVAGLDVETGQHVRPVPPMGVLQSRVTATRGGPFDMATVVDLGLTRPVPTPPEVEDHEMTWWHARASPPRRARLLLGDAPPRRAAVAGDAVRARPADDWPGGQPSRRHGPRDGVRVTRRPDPARTAAIETRHEAGRPICGPHGAQRWQHVARPERHRPAPLRRRRLAPRRRDDSRRRRPPGARRAGPVERRPDPPVRGTPGRAAAALAPGEQHPPGGRSGLAPDLPRPDPRLAGSGSPTPDDLPF